MKVTLRGVPITFADWIDDRMYSTVSQGSAADVTRWRPLPTFGEFPGDCRQGRFRWPDILHWYTNRPNDPTLRHDVLDELRKGNRRMTRMLASTLVDGLRVRVRDGDAIVNMLVSTSYGNVESEWALANLIDAAVELAADEHTRLAEAWAAAARERVWSVPDGRPL